MKVGNPKSNLFLFLSLLPPLRNACVPACVVAVRQVSKHFGILVTFLLRGLLSPLPRFVLHLNIDVTSPRQLNLLFVDLVKWVLPLTAIALDIVIIPVGKNTPEGSALWKREKKKKKKKKGLEREKETEGGRANVFTCFIPAFAFLRCLTLLPAFW